MWILIWVFLGGYQSVPVAIHQEFNTQAKCESAKDALRDTPLSSRVLICLPK